MTAAASPSPMPGPFETDERFDVIVFNQSLYYLTDPAGVLRKYGRC